jgi:hypothetical protein
MKRNLVVEDDIEEGVVNRQAFVVVNSVPRLHSRGNGTLSSGMKCIPPRLHRWGFL